MKMSLIDKTLWQIDLMIGLKVLTHKKVLAFSRCKNHNYFILVAQYSLIIFLVASGSGIYPNFLADLSPFLKA